MGRRTTKQILKRINNGFGKNVTASKVVPYAKYLSPKEIKEYVPHASNNDLERYQQLALEYKKGIRTKENMQYSQAGKITPMDKQIAKANYDIQTEKIIPALEKRLDQAKNEDLVYTRKMYKSKVNEGSYAYSFTQEPPTQEPALNKNTKKKLTVDQKYGSVPVGVDSAKNTHVGTYGRMRAVSPSSKGGSNSLIQRQTAISKYDSTLKQAAYREGRTNIILAWNKKIDAAPAEQKLSLQKQKADAVKSYAYDQLIREQRELKHLERQESLYEGAAQEVVIDKEISFTKTRQAEIVHDILAADKFKASPNKFIDTEQTHFLDKPTKEDQVLNGAVDFRKTKNYEGSGTYNESLNELGGLERDYYDARPTYTQMYNDHESQATQVSEHKKRLGLGSIAPASRYFPKD